MLPAADFANGPFTDYDCALVARSRLLSPMWLVGHAAVVLAVVVCVSLGFWQLDRRADRQAVNEQVTERIRPPTPLPVDGFTSGTANALRYRGVSAVGRYDPAHELLIRYRTFEGLPGYGVVTPLVLSDGGGVILVDRGWIPLERGETWPQSAGDAAAPSGEVTVAGWLAGPHRSRVAPEAPRPAERRPGIVSDVSAPQLRTVLPYPRLYEMTLVADGPEDRFPAPVGEPDISDGPHLGYAFQWFSFGAIAAIGWTAIALAARRRR
jgi:surfeit locus 1 family protein